MIDPWTAFFAMRVDGSAAMTAVAVHSLECRKSASKQEGVMVLELSNQVIAEYRLGASPSERAISMARE